MKQITLLYIVLIAMIMPVFAEPLQYPMQAIFVPSINKYFVAQNNNKTMLLAENLQDAELFQTYEDVPVITTLEGFLFAACKNTIIAYQNAKANNGMSGTINLNANIKSLAATKATSGAKIFATFDNNKLYLLSLPNPTGIVNATEINLNLPNEQLVSINAIRNNLYITTTSEADNSSKCYKYDVETATKTLEYTKPNDNTISGATEDKYGNLYCAFMGIGANNGYIVRKQKSTNTIATIANSLPVINYISNRDDNDNLVLSLNQVNEVRLILSGKAPKPILTYPVNQSIVDESAIVLKWKPIAGISNYTVKIAKDENFTSGLKIINVAKPNTEYLTLDKNTSYFWMVQGRNFDIEGEWSEVSKFTTSPTGLLPPTLLKPADKAEDVSPSPQFVWSKTKTGYLYQLQISESENFAAILAEGKNLDDTTLVLTNPLKRNQTYFWRVRTYTNLEAPSKWSEISSFTTSALPPGPPQLEYPFYNEVNVSLLPMFRWSSVVGATKYFLEVSIDVNFQRKDSTFKFEVPANTESNIQTYKLQDSILFSYTHYYYRIKAHTNKGETDWSEVRRFQTVNIKGNDGDNAVEYQVLDDQSIFPMPAKNHLYIKSDLCNYDESKIRIYNSAGKEMYQFDYTISSERVTINISQLESGAYNLVIETAKGIIAKRFIKE